MLEPETGYSPLMNEKRALFDAELRLRQSWLGPVGADSIGATRTETLSPNPFAGGADLRRSVMV